MRVWAIAAASHAMGSHEDGGAEVISSSADQAEDEFAARSVEITRGLIGDEEFRGLYNGARQQATRALHLTAGNLMRINGSSFR